jgi:hypothetical protein
MTFDPLGVARSKLNPMTAPSFSRISVTLILFIFDRATMSAPAAPKP